MIVIAAGGECPWRPGFLVMTDAYIQWANILTKQTVCNT